MTETKARFTPEQLLYKAGTFGTITTAKMLRQAAEDYRVLEQLERELNEASDSPVYDAGTARIARIRAEVR